MDDRRPDQALHGKIKKDRVQGSAHPSSRRLLRFLESIRQDASIRIGIPGWLFVPPTELDRQACAVSPDIPPKFDQVPAQPGEAQVTCTGYPAGVGTSLPEPRRAGPWGPMS